MKSLHVYDHWWEAPRGEAHGRVFENVSEIEERQSGIRSSMKKHLGLYLDREIGDISSVVRSRLNPLFGEAQRLNLNVIKSCIDTVGSKIVSHRPRPMFTTTDGKFSDRRKARGLERWVDGLFYREDLHTHHAPHVFLDAAITGTGCLKVCDDGSDVCLEWAWIGQIIIDEMSSVFSSPRVMFQRMYISRDVLMRKYPKFKDKIVGLEKEDAGEPGIVEDVVEVVEAWHLPSDKDGSDGKHCICVSDATLFEEDYKRDDFPFVFFRWGRTPIGFYGIGLAEELHGIQVEIKHLLNRIQEAMQLTAQVIIMKPRGTKIPDEHFTNRNGIILEYDGPTPPRYETPASMNSQVFQHVWRLRDAAYEIAGVSQLSASSVKPTGIESGIALRTLNDFETQRFALLSRDWEEFFLNVARKAISVAKEVYKGGGGVVRWADRTVVQEIEWKDVNLEEDSYVLRIYPSNMLPATPSGKLATIEQLLGMGLLDPDSGRSLLDFPDLEKVMNLKTAAHEDLMYVFDSMAEEIYIPPTPEMSLEYGIKMATSYWLKAHRDNAPEEVLDLYTRWIEEAKTMMMPPPQPMPMQGQGGAPGEMPPMEGMDIPQMPPEAGTASMGEAASQVLAPPQPQVLM